MLPLRRQVFLQKHIGTIICNNCIQSSRIMAGLITKVMEPRNTGEESNRMVCATIIGKVFNITPAQLPLFEKKSIRKYMIQFPEDLVLENERVLLRPLQPQIWNFLNLLLNRSRKYGNIPSSALRE